MFDIGWTELLVLGSLALIVVGPKELPRMLRTLGQYTAQARGMARDFQRSMEQAAREADITDMKELRDTADSLKKLRTMSVDSMMSEPKASKPKPASGGSASMRVDEGAAAEPAAEPAAKPAAKPASAEPSGAAATPAKAEAPAPGASAPTSAPAAGAREG